VLEFPIKTERLVLRPFEARDLYDVHAYRSLREVNRYLYSEPYTEDQTAENLAKWIGQDDIQEDGQSLALAIVLPEEDEVIGEVDLKLLSVEHRQAETGYILHPAYWGHGFATEAARETLRIGFQDYDLHRIQAECDARNEPSRQVMERLNMRREAHLKHHEIFKGEWGDSYVYAMLAEEYRDQK
jgi:RimJ/RimL family protein N-acetyltransferase